MTEFVWVTLQHYESHHQIQKTTLNYNVKFNPDLVEIKIHYFSRRKTDVGQ